MMGLTAATLDGRSRPDPMANVGAYLSGVFQQVQGWCIPHLWHCIEPLRYAMGEAGEDGPIAEIGVYHGKFLIGLVKTMDRPSGNTAIDVFDMQRFNLDGAGQGDLAALKANLQKASVPAGSVDLMRADSMALSRHEIEELRAKTGGFSMFSVDGCHLVEHTINDTRIAMELTRPHGIIFIDDYYNASWPGVQEGIAKLFLMETPRFVPLLYTCNKLFLCSLSYHSEYLAKVREFLKKNHPDTRVKPVKRFGYDTISVNPNMTAPRYLANR